MKKNYGKIILIASTLIVFCGLIAFIIISASNENKDEYRTGTVEMREYGAASKIPGRIDSIYFDEGDYVHQGDILVKLTTDEIEAKKAQAQGMVDAARGQMDMAYDGERPEKIDMALNGYLAAKSTYELAEKTYQRMEKVYKDSLISAQEFDGISQKYQSAREGMQAAKSQYDMAKAGARSEQKRMALGQYEAALSALREVNTYCDESTIKAPVSGIISKRYFDKGELVSKGFPVFSIVDTKDVWVELNLPESEMKYFKIGDKPLGFVHSIDKKVRFKAQNYSVLPDYDNWRAKNEQSTFEIRSFTLKMIPCEKIDNLRPGMTVSFKLNNRK